MVHVRPGVTASRRGRRPSGPTRRRFRPIHVWARQTGRDAGRDGACGTAATGSPKYDVVAEVHGRDQARTEPSRSTGGMGAGCKPQIKGLVATTAVAIPGTPGADTGRAASASAARPAVRGPVETARVRGATPSIVAPRVSTGGRTEPRPPPSKGGLARTGHRTARRGRPRCRRGPRGAGDRARRGAVATPPASARGDSAATATHAPIRARRPSGARGDRAGFAGPAARDVPPAEHRTGVIPAIHSPARSPPRAIGRVGRRSTPPPPRRARGRRRAGRGRSRRGR